MASVLKLSQNLRRSLCNSIHLFIGIRSSSAIASKSPEEWDSLTNKLHRNQVLHLEEECIQVDAKDNPIGPCSKKVCHLMENIDKGLLHRAFSVFLFNENNELLMQKRSKFKVTFPEHWTNTCCSHPLHNGAEMVSYDALGVKRAARRKLKHELGIEANQIPVSDFHFLTRVHYLAPNVPEDGVWGEHEIDYILFLRKNITLQPNDEEVSDYAFMKPEQLKELIEKSTFNPQSGEGLLVSPWFKLIYDCFLDTWWNNLDSLEKVKDTETIHRFC